MFHQSIFILPLVFIQTICAFSPKLTSHNSAYRSHSSSSSIISTHATQFNTSGMWNSGLSYGKGPFKFYTSFDSWMSPFAGEDKQLYPELFSLPKGVYEISLPKPLGIIFEEIEIGKGVYVVDMVEDGNAERQGTVMKGDILIGVTAVKVVGAKWERRLIPAKDLDFDTVVNAISSNEEKWGCTDVVLQFMRPDLVDDMEKINDHLDFFNPPGDSPWRM